MMAAILGFMPALDRRFSIAIRSGTAAKVVPKPATNPKISDRFRVGAKRLAVSRGTSSPSQPQRAPSPRRSAAKRNVFALALLMCVFCRDDAVGYELLYFLASRANPHIAARRTAPRPVSPAPRNTDVGR